MIAQYKLTDIKKWLSQDSEIKLPPVQRGFVWKHSQIENLWDSLLRGFPIGSFLISQNDNNKFLMDGQQRATSIAAGFYNPWENKDYKVGNVLDLPVVWIDIFPYKITTNNRFVIRVVTKSHPWGYKVGDNNERLGIDDRRKALSKYLSDDNQIVNYTSLSADKRFPFDCRLPIPLSFLLQCYDSDYSTWWKNVVEICKRHLSDFLYIKRITKGMDLEENYESLLDKCEEDSHRFILQSIETALHDTIIPAIVISKDLLDNDQENQDQQENPTLFVRFNSAGTELKGEELIYSIYKSIMPETKDLVESAGLSFISPSRMIVLASRLILSIRDNKYVPKITVKQFQKEIQDKCFKDALSRLIYDEALNLETMIKYTIEILKFNGKMPVYVIKNYISRCSDGVLLLMSWMYRNFKAALEVDLFCRHEDRIKKICARLYHAYFFGNTQGMVRQLWPFSNEKEFWIKHNPDISEYLLPLVPPNVLCDFLLDRITNKECDFSLSQNNKTIWEIWTNHWYKHEKEEKGSYEQRMQSGWNDFLFRLRKSEQLIVIAQKSYFESRFPEFDTCAENLQDTSTPWDVDHIFPKNWVDGKWHQDKRVCFWEHTIGNFRLMALSDNRSESNRLSPAERLREEDFDNYFIKENDWKYWSKLSKHGKIVDTDEESIINHSSAIITRMVNIYQNFYNMIMIKNEDDNTLKRTCRSFSKDTIFENSEWVCKADLCANISECAEIVNKAFEGKLFMCQNGEIHQLEDGLLSPEERFGLVRIFWYKIHRFKFWVSKDDFEDEVLKTLPYGPRPCFCPNIGSEPKEIMFSVRYSGAGPISTKVNYKEGFIIDNMLYDFGASNLLSEYWDEPDRYLKGSFDKDGKVIERISIR